MWFLLFFVFFLFNSATVNNLQAKVDALEKSNTKLTEEVSVIGKHLMFWPFWIRNWKDKRRIYFQNSGVHCDVFLKMKQE